MADSLENLVDTYCSAWSEPDPEKRARILGEVWADDARYTDPRADAIGIAELSGHIGRILAGRPGAKVVRTSAVDCHHALARFAWRVVEADGTLLPEGIDFAEVSEDRRSIRRIIGFFGPLAARQG